MKKTYIRANIYFDGWKTIFYHLKFERLQYQFCTSWFVIPHPFAQHTCIKHPLYVEFFYNIIEKDLSMLPRSAWKCIYFVQQVCTLIWWNPFSIFWTLYHYIIFKYEIDSWDQKIVDFTSKIYRKQKAHQESGGKYTDTILILKQS